MSRINGNHQPQSPQATNGRVSIASKRALTREYIGTMPTMHNRPRDLPPLNADLIRAMLLDSAVRLGLAMRAAPLMASEIAYKDGDKWTPGVRAEIPEVGEFIRRQYARIWLNGLESILTGQIWGWASGEVMLRTTRIGTVEVDYLLARSAMDTRALISDGEVAGTRVLKVKNVGHVDLKFPKGFFHAHRPEPGAHYGQSILLGCYSPWADKCFQGGALDVRRLFMHKDAYGGCDISYPDSTTIINGEEIPNRDIALQIVEQIQAGGVTTRPASYDVNGKEQWTITRATVPPSPGHILEYPKDLDTEIFHGMEIPDDVIESENGGAWAGKQVPMAAFYSSLDVWLISIVRDIDKQIIRPLLALNFKHVGAYEVTHKPLAVQASEQQQQAQQPPNGQQPGGMDGQMPSMKMGLDTEEAIGEGVLSASEMVQAARRVMALRMATVHAPRGGVNIAGQDFAGGEFIPGTVLKQATAEERRAIEGGKQAKNKQAPSEKSTKAKSSAKRIAGDVQRYAEEHNEPKFAKAIGGASFRDNEPIDVVLADDTGRVAHGIELKTMVDNGNNKITMKGDAIKRKLQWARRNKAAIHTVVIDDSAVFNANGPGKHDETKRRFFYRRGVGSFRIGKMMEVKSVEDIKRLLTTPTRQLPEGAR